MNRFITYILIILGGICAVVSSFQAGDESAAKAIKEHKLQQLVRPRLELLQSQAKIFARTHDISFEEALIITQQDQQLSVLQYRLKKAEEGVLPSDEFVQIEIDIDLALHHLLLADQLLQKDSRLKTDLSELHAEMIRENPISAGMARDRFVELILPLHEQKRKIEQGY